MEGKSSTQTAQIGRFFTLTGQLIIMSPVSGKMTKMTVPTVKSFYQPIIATLPYNAIGIVRLVTTYGIGGKFAVKNVSNDIISSKKLFPL